MAKAAAAAVAEALSRDGIDAPWLSATVFGLVLVPFGVSALNEVDELSRLEKRLR